MEAAWFYFPTESKSKASICFAIFSSSSRRNTAFSKSCCKTDCSFCACSRSTSLNKPASILLSGQYRAAISRSATLFAVVKLATESGFAFTAEEFLTVAHDEITRRQRAGELSDQQLEEISGGFGGDSTILLILAVILIGAGIFVKGDSTAAVKGDQLRRG